MRVEEYKHEIYGCAHCTVCRDIVDHVRGWKEVCPVYKQLRFQPYTAMGHNTIALNIVEGGLKYSEELADCLYKCTTCAACEEVCKPLSAILEEVGGAELKIVLPTVSEALGIGTMLADPIPSVAILKAMRADCVDLGLDPEPIKKLASALEKTHNPYGEAQEDKIKWAEGLNIPEKAKIVFFPGCEPAYRAQEIVLATAKILKSAGIEFAVLGDEWCCGNPAFDAGYIDLGERLVRHNVEVLKKAGAEKVVTTCPACYKTLKNDYPKIVGELPFEVVHISELLEDLIREGKIKPGAMREKITYHDPCQLGRVMGMYREPRAVLNAIPGLNLVEMYPTRQASWCCGAGGEVIASNPGLAVNIAMEKVPLVQETGADLLVTTCPACKRNLELAAKRKKAGYKVKDLVEVVAQSMGL